MKRIGIGVVGAGIFGNYPIHTYCCEPRVEKIMWGYVSLDDIISVPRR